MSSPKGQPNLKGVCNVRCFRAKSSRCVCRCHKKYHGLARKTSEERERILEEKREPNFDEIIEQSHKYTLSDFF